jgi:hypothetical protein
VKREADNAVTTTGKNRIMIFGPKGDGTYVVEFRAGRGRRFRGFAECEVT